MSRHGTLAAVGGYGMDWGAAGQLGRGGGAAARLGVVPRPHRGGVAVPQAVLALDREERLLVLLARGVALPGRSGHDAMAV